MGGSSICIVSDGSLLANEALAADWCKTGLPGAGGSGASGADGAVSGQTYEHAVLSASGSFTPGP